MMPGQLGSWKMLYTFLCHCAHAEIERNSKFHLMGALLCVKFLEDFVSGFAGGLFNLSENVP